MAKELQRVRRIPIECRRSIQPRFYTLRNLAAVSFFRMSSRRIDRVNVWRSEGYKRLVICAHLLWGLIAVTQIHPSTARATTTLAIVDQKHNQMIVASDSLRLTSNGIISVTSQVCKILVGPNCIFSVAGYVSNSSTNFDLANLETRLVTKLEPSRIKLMYLINSRTNPLTTFNTFARLRLNLTRI
jgi:hypothetical protein